jgi:hypothetical protein
VCALTCERIVHGVLCVAVELVGSDKVLGGFYLLLEHWLALRPLTFLENCDRTSADVLTASSHCCRDRNASGMTRSSYPREL